MGRSYGRCRPWSSFAYSPACSRWLRQRLANARSAPQIVHLHGVLQHVTTAAAAHARRHGIPYVVEPYGALDPHCLRMGFRGLKQLAVRLWLPGILQHAACVQPASVYEADVVASGSRQIASVSFPTGWTFRTNFRPTPRSGSSLRFPAVRGKRVILFIGPHPSQETARTHRRSDGLPSADNERPRPGARWSGRGSSARGPGAARRHKMEDSVVYWWISRRRSEARGFRCRCDVRLALHR